MDQKVYELINAQINAELYSAYLYLSFADYYEEEGLEGYANFYEIQAAEERDHALIFRNYLHDNGMKVKLSIASALAHHPKLLLLDEPTSGLDPVVRDEILSIFFDFIQDEEHTILMSSHITGDLEKIADYVTFLHQGRLVFSGVKDDLLDSHGIVKCNASERKRIDPKWIVKQRTGPFGCEILVNNKAAVRHLYPELLVDNASLEEIMLFHVKGEK